MSVRVRHLRVLALLLAVIFLGAQFHYCADLTAGPSGSHLCPLCSAVGSAVTPGPPSVAIAPVTHRFEVAPAPIFVSFEIPRFISPRAPPQL